MKLALLVVGLLLVSNTVTAVPRDMSDLMEYLEEKIANMQDIAEVEDVDGNMQDEDVPPEEVELTGGEEKTPEDTTSTVDEDEEKKEPDTAPAYLEEEVAEQYSDTDADAQQFVPLGTQIVYSGDIIALQSYIDHNWLGCAGALCSRATCPRMYMVGADWNNCWGEVFQIFRLSHAPQGRGPVLVGDSVGIYYPRQPGHWLGCAGHHCGKAGCPGLPNLSFGFNNPSRLGACWGEVFNIYAYGKSEGQVITSDDRVALFYPRERRWFALGPSGPPAHKQPCLGTGLPPHPNKWDGCAWELFRLTKRID